MKLVLLISFSCFFIQTISAHSETAGTGSSFSVRLLVTDDNGDPIPTADAGFSWGLIGGAKPDSDFARKMTDKIGMASFRGTALVKQYAYGATKSGYYSSRGSNGSFEKIQNGRWLPWDQQVQVVLKPIKNPVPMYAKVIDLLIPAVGHTVGYDLETGDWVAPYGNGTMIDFEFSVESQYESRLNYHGKLTLRLPGQANGILAYDLDPIQQSELKLPHQAPENGYARTWVWQNSRTTKIAEKTPSTFVDDSNGMRGFIFRVRSVLNDQNEVVSAHYGKIHGPVYFRTFEKGQARIGFTYYYNPDGTRNLEFDPKRNLFPSEHVIEP